MLRLYSSVGKAFVAIYVAFVVWNIVNEVVLHLTF